jgi:hypothetical protein
MNNREMEAWLAKIPVISKLDSEQERAIMETLGSPGLTALLGLLFGSRQALYAQVSYAPNGDPVMSHRVSVLQGKIQGLELVVQTVRELAVPSSGEVEAEGTR